MTRRTHQSLHVVEHLKSNFATCLTNTQRATTNQPYGTDRHNISTYQIISAHIV